MKTSYFPAEWEEQSAIQLTWPTKNSDWVSNFLEAETCYVAIAKAIVAHQLLLIVGEQEEQVLKHFTAQELHNIIFISIEYNDTWTRDHGGITVFENGSATILDYQFNAWGNKFECAKDNLITSQLISKGVLSARYKNQNDFVLEGGALESNGKGILLTTAKCIFNKNRNPKLRPEEVLKRLKKDLFVEKIICLNHGEIVGDDTDAHIDTLTRFVDENTIVYLQCDDPSYPSHLELQKMEEELLTATNLEGESFELIPIKLATKVRGESERLLPATYVNFLILNEAVLVPIYGVKEDEEALLKLSRVFPNRKVIGINCLPLIQQNGSLHCITMQFPKAVKINRNL